MRCSVARTEAVFRSLPTTLGFGLSICWSVVGVVPFPVANEAQLAGLPDPIVSGVKMCAHVVEDRHTGRPRYIDMGFGHPPSG